MNSVEISQCKDYEDFCQRAGMSGKRALEFLIGVLEGLRREMKGREDEQHN